MASFYCKAVNAAGDNLNELREGESIDTVIKNLQKEGYIPIRVVKAESLLARFYGVKKKVLNHKQILLFTQKLATLLQAGLPLDNALKTMQSLTQDSADVSDVVDILLKKIKQGEALSFALEQQSCGFTKFYIGIIKAGEAGGDLAGSLQHLADYLERVESLRSTIVSAMVYPAILLLSSIVSIILLMTLVLPQFADLFESAGKSLPLPTVIVMSISEWLQSYWWTLLVIFIGFAMLFQYIQDTQHLRYRWDTWILKLPLIGDLLSKVEVARFSYTLESLLGKGVPLLDALITVKNTMSNTAMSELIDLARTNLKQGKPISLALAHQGRFPILAIQMIKLGEETGNLQGVLARLSITYDKEVKISVQRMLSLFEPALILTLGVVIAGIIFSVLMAVVSLNDFTF